MKFQNKQKEKNMYLDKTLNHIAKYNLLYNPFLKRIIKEIHHWFYHQERNKLKVNFDNNNNNLTKNAYKTNIQSTILTYWSILRKAINFFISYVT